MRLYKILVSKKLLYLKVNATFYFLRNSMQGFGDSRTPLISSLIELAGKVMIAMFLVPSIGYMGVIVSEPIVWVFMVMPLLISILCNPIFKGNISC